MMRVPFFLREEGTSATMERYFVDGAVEVNLFRPPGVEAGVHRHIDGRETMTHYLSRSRPRRRSCSSRARAGSAAGRGPCGTR